MSKSSANGHDLGTQRNKILTTRVGLQFPEGVEYSDWQRAGSQIARVIDSFAWCLGDWLVYGQERYADRYQQAVAAAGLEYQTLRNYAWVARRFEFPRRREALSFQHHAEIAALPAQEQDRWMDQAEQNGWSRNQLRQAVRTGRRDATREASRTAVLPQVQVAAEKVERWRQAAEHEYSGDLQRWVVETLDAAAARSLSSEISAA
jgi:hypothetical protein